MSAWQPIDTVVIPLTLGQYAIIDDVDLPLISQFSWHARHRRDRRGFYAVNSAGIRMHRLLLGVWGGDIVDHRDGNGLNNTRGNLRKGTQSQNCVNRRTTPGPNLRGARRKGTRWQAYIKYKNKQTSLGYFETEREAHEAYILAASQKHGDWMPLPPPPGGV